MKIYCIFIATSITVSCTFNSKVTNKTKSSVDEKFSIFLEQFNPMPDSFVIENSNDRAKYHYDIWSDTSPMKSINNPALKPINKSEYNFINSKYQIKDSNLYYSIFLREIKSYYALIIRQDNDSTQEYWLTLNIFDKKGDLIDTLIIAGQEVEQRDRFCVIDSNFNINIREEKCIPPFEENSSDILETKETYVVSSSGHFQKIKSSKRRGRYVYHEKEDEYMLEFYDE